MVAFFARRRSQRESLNALPLYPNEDIMWDESLIPSVQYSGQGCLALPKLNLQFLTLHDYLLRNFNLFRLESTYEIREEVADVLPRLGAQSAYSALTGGGSGGGGGLREIDVEGTTFTGWARMAVQLASLRIVEVRAPLLGEAAPAAVHAEVEISLGRYPARSPVRGEWNELKQHDVLFLLAVHPDEIAAQAAAERAEADEAAALLEDEEDVGGGNSAAALATAAGAQAVGRKKRSKVPPHLKYGLRYVRGCEIIEVKDEDGNLVNDFTGRVKPEDRKPPKGDKRTLLVALDPAQFQLDVEAHGGGQDGKSTSWQGAVESVYGTLNVVMRRKPKENNFKPILESIRDLMNEQATVPPWLHDIFLGYDDPAAASWRQMPAELEPWRLTSVDFKDTFVDAQHLRDSFPGCQVGEGDAEGWGHSTGVGDGRGRGE